MGVTNPYLYVGSWRAMFGWHKEDMDLYSINFLHTGNPKFWYSIDLKDNKNFESFVNHIYVDDYRECPEFIRHKNTLIHPRNLLQQKIRLKKVTQYPGEFVISRAAAYHAGFNAGFNLAEAVNFALPSWIPIGRKAGICQCQPDSVKINMDTFERRLRNY
jgi:[histone H3]-trimethyl-L-lysine9/36 demethylase